MSKIKMRCITCGKWFQSANAKEVTCPDCTQKARREKLAAKSGAPTANKPAGQGTNVPPRQVPPPPKPKPATGGGTSSWLDTVSDVKVSEPDQPTRPKLPPSPAPREQRGGQERSGYREGGSQGPGGFREGGQGGQGGRGGHLSPAAYRVGDISGTIGQRPRQPMEPGVGRGPRPGGPGEPRPERPYQGGKQAGKPAKPKAARPPTPPKPKKEKIPPPEPFKPTPEQVAQVEARYLELAVPTEFDGIRTQIATEMSIPKKAVKQIIKELRDRESIPSWWDLQTYKGDSEELAKIREAYEPHLPVPPIGVHKTIADALSLKAGDVYQAIKLIRQEMNLPQYNDPVLHGLDLESIKKRKSAPRDGEKVETRAEGEVPATTTSQPVGSEDGTQAPEAVEKAEVAAGGEPAPATLEGVASAGDGVKAVEVETVESAASTVPVPRDGDGDSEKADHL